MVSDSFIAKTKIDSISILLVNCCVILMVLVSLKWFLSGSIRFCHLSSLVVVINGTCTKAQMLDHFSNGDHNDSKSNLTSFIVPIRSYLNDFVVICGLIFVSSLVRIIETNSIIVGVL